MPQRSPTFTRPTMQLIVLALNALIDPIVFSSYHTGPLVASSHFVQQRETIARISVMLVAIPRFSWALKVTYSEQKNRPTKGQISLVRLIAAQITKVNLWEISITKVDILIFVVPNNKHLALFVKFILTLRWDPFDGTVFLHTLKLALHIYIT